MKEQKKEAELFCGKDNWQTRAFPEEGIRSLRMADGPSGLRIEKENGTGFNQSYPAVAFPSEAMLGCSFDTELLRQVGTALSEACGEAGVDILLGPGINHKRDPRGGRNFEYFSEDPLLTASLATAYIRGLQENGTGCSLKHFAANSRETGRQVSDSIIDERALREIYLRAFEETVREADPATVMCAYNKLNGVYCTENSYLMRTVARGEWGFRGLFVSDWGAISDPVSALNAGLNLEMPGGEHGTAQEIEAALKTGKTKEEILEENTEVFRSLCSRFGTSIKTGQKEDHIQLCLEAAEKSAVLLKNDGTLPLAGTENILLIGALAENPRSQGAGSSRVNTVFFQNYPDGFSNFFPSVKYAPGYHSEIEIPDPLLEEQALMMAEKAEIIVFVGGIPEGLDGEGFDRVSLSLPGNQNRLLARLAEKKKKTVVILQTPGPVEMPWLSDVNAVLCMYLSGCQGAAAAASLLCGDSNPCGRLAETWPLDLKDVPSCNCFTDDARDVFYRESIFTGYRYYTTFGKEVLFPFGYGLSYTKFSYSGFEADWKGGGLKVSLRIRNTGQCAGREIVQIYFEKKNSAIVRPLRELCAFAAVDLAAGEEKTVELSVPERHLCFWDVSSHSWCLEDGWYELQAGSSSASILLHKMVHIKGTDVQESFLSPTYCREGFPQEQFLKMIKKWPEKQQGRPFDRNTTLNELKESFFGRRVHASVRHVLKVHPFPDVHPSEP